MSALTIGLATAGTLIGVGLVYYGLKGSTGSATGAGSGAGSATGAGAGVGYSPYAPTTYDNLEGPRQQVYGGRGRKSKRTSRTSKKRTAVSRRLRRSKRSN